MMRAGGLWVDFSWMPCRPRCTYQLSRFLCRRVQQVLQNHAECWESLFYTHNCFLDTWSSIFTLIHATALLLYGAFIGADQWETSWSDRVPLVLMFLVAVLHAPASVSYHLFGCSGMSYEWFRFYQRLDFLFIFVSSVPLVVALAWYPWSGAPWAVATGGAAVALLSLVTLVRIKRDPTPRQRIVSVGVLVLVYFSPLFWQVCCDPKVPCLGPLLRFSMACVCVGVWAFGCARAAQAGSDVVHGNASNGTLWWAIGAVVSLALGSWVYGSHVPECWLPDFPVNGHALMHVAINLAYFCEWKFIRSAFSQSQV
jgi:hypothetical protein